MEYIVIIIGSIFVSNIVLSQFLGICPFVGVSGKLSTSIGMGGAVLFVLTLATMVTWIIPGRGTTKYRTFSQGVFPV